MEVVEQEKTVSAKDYAHFGSSLENHTSVRLKPGSAFDFQAQNFDRVVS